MKEYSSVILYFAVIGIISVVLTVYDKAAAKLNKRRIPEKSLIFTALAGGALPMFAAMTLIRHKTRHKKFMLGLPAIMLLHAVLLVTIIIIK